MKCVITIFARRKFNNHHSTPSPLNESAYIERYIHMNISKNKSWLGCWGYFAAVICFSIKFYDHFSLISSYMLDIIWFVNSTQNCCRRRSFMCWECFLLFKTTESNIKELFKNSRYLRLQPEEDIKFDSSAGIKIVVRFHRRCIGKE